MPDANAKARPRHDAAGSAYSAGSIAHEAAECYSANMRRVSYSNIDFRRLLSAFVAVAFLMVSVGIVHAMPASGPDALSFESAFVEGSGQAGNSRTPDCAENSAQQDQGHPAKNAAVGNCCIVSCSPTVVVTAPAQAVVINFTLVRLGVPVDLFAGSNAPDGLFRPPRALV